MESTIAAEILTEMRVLWHRWEPDDAEWDSWTRLLERLADPATARRALQTLRDTTDWLGPKRAQLLEIIGKSAPRGNQQSNAQHTGHPGMYVQCVSHETRPGAIGEFRTLYWPTDHEMPPEHVIMARMEAFRAEQQALYGGDWQLVRSFSDPLDDGAMIRRRAELRPTSTRRGPLWRLIQNSIDKLRGLPPQDYGVDEQPPEEYRGTPDRPARQPARDFMAGKPKPTPPPPDRPGPELPVSPDLGDEPF